MPLYYEPPYEEENPEPVWDATHTHTHTHTRTHTHFNFYTKKNFII